jgi:uncharacterized membrane protein (DUF106 family)
MSDDQIISLLTEIRDLQKQNTENYKLALQNQREAIEFQKSFAARQKKVVLLVIVVVIVTFSILAFLPHLLRYR